MIGSIVTVKIDRPSGSRHPEYKDMIYPINYGYIEGITAPDGEWQDAYIIGIDESLAEFTGEVIAVIRRNDDAEEKWVVAPKGQTFSAEYIKSQVEFQERFFDYEIRI
ncbi:MAG: inorganic pyrophosphatase [Eubacteriales bacterium]|jgi:inorganic pyrophosphatase